MNKKFIIITFSNGEKYKIPAEFIAVARAKYYADLDSRRDINIKYDEIYQQELEYSLNNNDEILDWADNNMNWEDVKDVTTFIEQIKEEINYEKEWTNSEKEIVEE